MNGLTDGVQMKNKMALALITFSVIGCTAQTPLDDYSHYLRNKEIASPTLENFPHCYDYGCRTVQSVSLSQTGWQKLNTLFSPPSQNASQERARVSQAIQIFEQDIGAQIGTNADLKGTFKPFTRETETPLRFQQDCVDESTNTTIYLSILDQKGWLQFHRVTQPQSRQPFIGGNRWWHQSATIKETGTDQQYAVDSWFEDNGAPAYTVKIEDWFNNWKPAEKLKNTTKN